MKDKKQIQALSKKILKKLPDEVAVDLLNSLKTYHEKTAWFDDKGEELSFLKEKKNDEAELQKAIARNDTVSHLYKKLYEDNAVGKVSDVTAPLLRELIDHIDVFETEGKGKNRTQRIVIYYRFVGYVEIPEVSQRQHIKADTRKGVAVEYLTA